jgi:RHS repeat-associated protein
VLTTLPAAAGGLAGSYYEAFTYNPDGTTRTSVGNATGGLRTETMTYGYDEYGQPSRVSGTSADFGTGTVYVDEAVYSPYGQLLQRRLGDPADVGGTSGQTWQTWIYEEGTGRLAEFYFDKDTAGEFDGTNYGIAALSYEYDDAGKILSITDQPVHTSDALQPETQCFQYDYLNRLTEAWAQAGATECAATPTEDAVGGPGAYWSSYQYNLSGNRTSETYWTTSGRFTDTYTYEQGSHALTNVATTENGDENTNFTYDSTGYTTSIDRAGDLTLLDWNASGRLNTATNGENVTTFYDDADGSRLVRKDPNGDITAWVAGYELHYDATAGTKVATRYYTHGGDVVAQRVGLGDILFVTGDHHGTGQWIVNGDTLTAIVRRFDPFGNERGLTQGTWPDERGFIGGIDNDTTGLTTIGAREYDPTTGRFVSVDPIADYADPQQLNGYAYSNNNPVNLSDPTGLCATGPSVIPGTWEGPCAGSPNSSGGGNSSTPEPVATGSSDGGTTYGEQYGNDYTLDSEGGCVYVLQGAVGVPCDMWEGDLQDLVEEIEDYLYEIGEVVDPVTGMFDPTQIAWATTDLCFGGDYYANVVDNCQMEYLEVLDDQRMAIDQAWATDAAERNPWAAALIADLSGGILQAGSASFTAPWMTGAIGLQSYFRNKNYLRCNSFEAGTLIVMADGTTKPIEEIEAGEEVLSVDMTTGERVPASVSAATSTPRQSRSLVEIEIDSNGDGIHDGSITTTSGHAFWVTASTRQASGEPINEWVHARDITRGSWLQNVDWNSIQVVGVWLSIEVVSAYNLSIGGTHSYFVAAGSSEILSHNCEPAMLTDISEAYVRSKHFKGGSALDKTKGVFDDGVDLDDIVDAANQCRCAGPNKDGNYERVVDFGSIVGNTSAVGGGKVTSWVLVVQDRFGGVVTMYPVPGPG